MCEWCNSGVPLDDGKRKPSWWGSEGCHYPHDNGDAEACASDEQVQATAALVLGAVRTERERCEGLCQNSKRKADAQNERNDGSAHKRMCDSWWEAADNIERHIRAGDAP